MKIYVVIILLCILLIGKIISAEPVEDNDKDHKIITINIDFKKFFTNYYNEGPQISSTEKIKVDENEDDKWLKETLKFLKNVKSDNKILQDIYDATNEPDFGMMKHFLKMQNEFMSELSFDWNHFRLEINFLLIKRELTFGMEILKRMSTMIYVIDNFLSKNIHKSRGRDLLNLILSEDFLKELSRAANEKLKDNMDLKTTPQRAVLDFIYGGFLLVIKEYAIYAAIAEKLGAASPFTPKFVEISFQHSFNLIKMDQDLMLMLNKHSQLKHESESYFNFDPLQNTKMIKFEIFLQKLVNAEEELNGNSCDYKCEWITRKNYPYDGCKGELRDCNSLNVKMNSEVNVVFSENPTKIHKIRRYQPFWIFGYTCDICECTCDQINHPLTERFLYAGKIEAKKGYVVTGVRFAKKNRVIFLQLQVGKFNENGYINKSSLYWMEAPEDLTENFHTLTYDNRFMNIKASDLGASYFMTGFQFVKFHDFITFKIIGEFRKNGIKTDVIKSKAKQVQLIAFKASDLDFDFGQVTIPFFNGEDIVFDPPMAVTGLGFRHIENKVDGADYVKPFLIHNI